MFNQTCVLWPRSDSLGPSIYNQVQLGFTHRLWFSGLPFRDKPWGLLAIRPYSIPQNPDNFDIGAFNPHCFVQLLFCYDTPSGVPKQLLWNVEVELGSLRRWWFERTSEGRPSQSHQRRACFLSLVPGSTWHLRGNLPPGWNFGGLSVEAPCL